MYCWECGGICRVFCRGIFIVCGENKIFLRGILKNLNDNCNRKLIIFFLLLFIMAGRYSIYYYRRGKGKNKRYGCLLCDHKLLPTRSGIVSHLERTHGREIDEDERKEREWKEEQRRKKEEEKNSAEFTAYYEDPFTGEIASIEEVGV